MIPDAATVARRRHTVTIVARSFIALLGVWIIWDLATGIGGAMQQWFESGWASPIGILVYLLLRFFPTMLVFVAIVLFHEHLVRWIVPPPLPDNACPKCGYSLKDLKSPICPECGTSLRS